MEQSFVHVVAGYHFLSVTQLLQILGRAPALPGGETLLNISSEPGPLARWRARTQLLPRGPG